MSEQVNLGRQGFSTRAYQNAIDTSFTQLIPPPPPVEAVYTVEEFFDLYNTLFYEIPAEGDVNSHRFLINRSTEYIGFTEEKEEDIQVLLDEITQLREELLETQRQLSNAENSGSLLLEAQSGLSNNEIQTGTQITDQSTFVGTTTTGGGIGGY